MAGSYYYLKKRNIGFVRRRSLSIQGSEVAKMPEALNLFQGLKIPRVCARNLSGTEELTESAQSDFGSDIAIR